MRTRNLAGGLCLLGIVLLAVPGVAAEGPWITADDEANIGETFHFGYAGLPSDTRNATVIVYGPRGVVAYRFYEGARFASAGEDVTSEWGSGGGTVRLVFDNATGIHEDQRAFRVVCPPACVLQLVTEAAGQLATGYLLLATAAIFLAVLYTAHVTYVYAVRTNEPPWTTRVSLAVRGRISRDPLLRSKIDPLGLLPDALHEELERIQLAIADTDQVRSLAQRAWVRVRRQDARARRAKAAAKKEADAPSNPPPPPEE